MYITCIECVHHTLFYPFLANSTYLGRESLLVAYRQGFKRYMLSSPVSPNAGTIQLFYFSYSGNFSLVPPIIIPNASMTRLNPFLLATQHSFYHHMHPSIHPLLHPFQLGPDGEGYLYLNQFIRTIYSHFHSRFKLCTTWYIQLVAQNLHIKLCFFIYKNICPGISFRLTRKGWTKPCFYPDRYLPSSITALGIWLYVIRTYLQRWHWGDTMLCLSSRQQSSTLMAVKLELTIV